MARSRSARPRTSHLGHRAAGGTFVSHRLQPCSVVVQAGLPSAWRTGPVVERPAMRPDTPWRPPTRGLSRSRHPTVRAIYDYWDRKRGDRRMPAARSTRRSSCRICRASCSSTWSRTSAAMFTAWSARARSSARSEPDGQAGRREFPRQLARERAGTTIGCVASGGLFDDYHFTSPGGRLREQAIFCRSRPTANP